MFPIKWTAPEALKDSVSIDSNRFWVLFLLVDHICNYALQIFCSPFLCLHRRLVARGVPFWGCLCMCPSVRGLCDRMVKVFECDTWNSAGGNFTKFTTWGAVVDKDEPIWFWDQKVKGQGHNKTKRGRHEWWRFEGQDSNVKVTDYVSNRGIPIGSLPWKAM